MIGSWSGRGSSVGSGAARSGTFGVGGARTSWALGLASLTFACGGAAPPPQPTSGGAECPPGQTFDGHFCRVDGELAQSEPLPEAREPAATGEGETATESRAAESPTKVEVEPEAEPEEDGGLRAEEATPVDVSMAAQAGPAITYLAGSHLPAGAQPLGAPFAAQFAEGQVFEQKVQLTVGRCYTIVAAGIPPVRDVDIELFVEGEEDPIAKDDAVGPQAVLGSRDRCFVAQSAEVRLVVTVAKGQGVVAGQVFEK